MRELPITVILFRLPQQLPERQLVYQLFEDLTREGIGVMFGDARSGEYYPWAWWSFSESSVPHQILEDWFDNFSYIERHPWRDAEWTDLTRVLGEIADRDVLSALTFVVPFARDAQLGLLDLDFFPREANLCMVNIAIREGAVLREERIERLISFDYPEDRNQLLRFLKGNVDIRTTESESSQPSAPRRAARRAPSRAPFGRGRHRFNEMPTAGRGMSSREAERGSARERASVRDIERELDEVSLGASAPRTVAPGEAFVARFAAYTEESKSEIRRVLKLEAPSTQLRLDLDKCRWRGGAKVTVRLGATDATVLNPVQAFDWDGNSQILRFDVEVHDKVIANSIILRFDVAVEGLPIVSLRPEISVRPQHDSHTVEPSTFVEKRAPRTAFASYAQKDRREVLGRVRSLQIFTGIDVFLDCLSLRPGDTWKPELQKEIYKRDIFWLFWSRNAMNSEWVDWEWRTALIAKALDGIQPHPLEPAELAPPPEELSPLQFGAMYEWYLSHLRRSWLSSQCRALWSRAAFLARRVFTSAGSR